MSRRRRLLLAGGLGLAGLSACTDGHATHVAALEARVEALEAPLPPLPLSTPPLVPEPIPRPSPDAGRDFARAMAKAMQGSSAKPVLDLLRAPDEYASECLFDPRSKDSLSEATIAQMKTHLHACVPPGELASVELRGSRYVSCWGLLEEWILPTIEVETARGSARIRPSRIVQDGAGRWSWMERDPLATPPTCRALTTTPADLAASLGLGRRVAFPTQAGAIEPSMSLAEVDALWGDAAAVARTRCRSHTLRRATWHEQSAFGTSTTARYDGDSGLCLWVESAHGLVDAVRYELMHDPSLPETLTTLWGEPAAAANAEHAIESYLWFDASSGFAAALEAHPMPEAYTLEEREQGVHGWVLRIDPRVPLETLIHDGDLDLDRPGAPALLGASRAELVHHYASLLCDPEVSAFANAVSLCPPGLRESSSDVTLTAHLSELGWVTDLYLYASLDLAPASADRLLAKLVRARGKPDTDRTESAYTRRAAWLGEGDEPTLEYDFVVEQANLSLQWSLAVDCEATPEHRVCERSLPLDGDRSKVVFDGHSFAPIIAAMVSICVESEDFEEDGDLVLDLRVDEGVVSTVEIVAPRSAEALKPCLDDMLVDAELEHASGYGPRARYRFDL